MDRIDRAINRLWGPLGEDGRLGPEPSFASDLANQCGGNLHLQTDRVSKWSFGEQLEHLYLSSHYVLNRVEESLTEKNANRHMGFYGVGLMVGGFIPRYVFPTIPPLEPVGGTLDQIQPLKDQLRLRLESLRWDLQQIHASQGKSLHPRMKFLTASQWLYFADIHHRHHLSIIQDICKVAEDRIAA